MGEVLDWFRKKKISFISSIPKVVGKFSNDEKLFKQQNSGDFIDRFNIQFEMILNYQYKEGGLFMMIGKRNKINVPMFELIYFCKASIFLFATM